MTCIHKIYMNYYYYYLESSCGYTSITKSFNIYGNDVQQEHLMCCYFNVNMPIVNSY